jgi:hypothetical protein
MTRQKWAEGAERRFLTASNDMLLEGVADSIRLRKQSSSSILSEFTSVSKRGTVIIRLHSKT